MHAVIIGAGIAGCSAAFALARRGVEVTLLEESPRVASLASGNPVGILHPRLEKQWNPVTRFYAAAFGYARRQLAELGGKGEWWESPGMLQFPKARDRIKSEARFSLLPQTLGLPEEIARFISAEEAFDLTHLTGPYGALYFPQGTWVQPQRWCELMLSCSPLIRVIRETRALSLQKNSRGWRVQTASGACEATHVIVANAYAATAFSGLSHLPLQTSRGQITLLPAQPQLPDRLPILCYDGYFTPRLHGQHVCGSTYEQTRTDTQVDPAGHRHNLTQLQALWPKLFAGVDIERLAGRAALRTVTPDRLPLIGQIAPGLLVTLGHGSRGLLSAPLGAETLASLICGEPAPLDQEVLRLIHPLRFGDICAI